MALSASGLWVEAPLYRWAVALPSLVVLLQLATHEAGHALAAMFRGYSVETVFVTAPAAGVVPARSSRDIDPRDFLWIALWGPLANLVAGGLAVLVVRSGMDTRTRRLDAPSLPHGILSGMPDSTTIKVSVQTRDALRKLARQEGLTFDAQIAKLVRRERRRIIGAQLASAPLDADDKAVLDASASDVADASR